MSESLDFCTVRFGGGEPTFAGASCNDQDASHDLKKKPEFVKVEPLKTVLSGNRGRWLLGQKVDTEILPTSASPLRQVKPPTRCFDLPPQMSILRNLAGRLSFEVNGRLSWVVLAAASGRDFPIPNWVLRRGRKH